MDEPHLTRDFAGYGARPPDPQWPDGARLAVNLVVNYEEGAEASCADGDATSEAGLTEGGSGNFRGRDLAAESMFEYGSRIGVWRLLRLLEEQNAPATIFACALALERNPAVADAIRQSRHDVCAHGWRWVRHQDLTEDEERAAIDRAYRSIAATTGRPPQGWYCRYAPSVRTRRLIVEHGGFTYDSDAYNDELPYWTRVRDRSHLVIPYTLANNDAKFARGNIGTAQDFFEYLRDSFDLLYEEGATRPAFMSVGLHCRIAGHPGRALALRRFLQHVRSRDAVWICRRADVADHWRKIHPPNV